MLNKAKMRSLKDKILAQADTEKKQELKVEVKKVKKVNKKKYGQAKK